MNFLALAGSSYEDSARGILYVIYEILWKLIYYVLVLVDEVSKLFYKVAGINVTDGVVEKKNMFSQLLEHKFVTQWYPIFIAIAAALVIVFTLVSILRTVSSDGETEKRSYGPLLKNVGLALLLLLLVGPIAILLISLISNVGIFIASIGGDNNISIADILFNNSGNLLTVYNETNGANISSFRNLGNDFLYDLMYNPKEGVAKLDFYWYIALLGGTYVLYNLACMVMDIVKRIFNIVLLYLGSPFAISKMALDEGKSFKQWQGKFFYEFSLFLTQMGTFMVFIALVNVLAEIDFEGMVTETPDEGLLDGGLYEPGQDAVEEVVPVTFSLLNGVGRTLIIMAAASVTRSSATMLADLLKASDSKTENLLEVLLTKMPSRSGAPVTKTRTVTRNTTSTRRETVFVQLDNSKNKSMDTSPSTSKGKSDNVITNTHVNQNVTVNNKFSANNTFNNRTVKEGVTKGGYASEKATPSSVYINATKVVPQAASTETFKLMEGNATKGATSAFTAYNKANENLTSAIQSGDSTKLQSTLQEYTKAYSKEADVLSNNYRQFENRAQDTMKSAISNQAKEELKNISNAYRKTQMDYNKTASKLKEYDGERMSTADALRLKEQADKQRERLMSAANRAAEFYHNLKKGE